MGFQQGYLKATQYAQSMLQSMPNSEVPSTVLFSSGLCPSENSTVEGTEGP